MSGGRGRVGWAIASGDPKKTPRPLVVLAELDDAAALSVCFGTSNVHRENATIVEPGTRAAAAWIATGRPLTNRTAFYPEAARIDRVALAGPLGGLLLARLFVEIEAKLEAVAMLRPGPPRGG